jgi:predicted O-methyltransferase YrrM
VTERGGIVNTAKNALRPRYARVMAEKLLRHRRGGHRKDAEAVAWAAPRSVAIAAHCRALDARLWDEAVAFGAELRERAKKLGAELGVKLGGGGRAELCFFAARWRRPQVILETGVLHGYSSASFLEALARNGDGGRLLSSDFPYFRERDPERLVGVLVPEHLRAQWTLLLEGDRRNLPRLLEQVDRLDLVHYDSDKTYEGRRLAMALLEPKLAADAVVLMDDIQDNLFFRDWIDSRDSDVAVLGTGAYFVGAKGLGAASG